MDRNLRQRISTSVVSRLSLRETAGSVEISLSWTKNRNRQKVLGFAAMAVSLVLVSAPFFLNVDSDTVAKAQTVTIDTSTTTATTATTAEVITEMTLANDVIVALNATRHGANSTPVERDELLQIGAQAWAANVADNGNVRTDRSLRMLLNDRSAVGEFVVVAPSLPIAYDRLMANRSQQSQLTDEGMRNIGVGVHISSSKTYLVIRFSA